MPPIPTEPNPFSRPIRDTGATLLTLSGLGAAFGVASCCGLPFLLATAGLSTAWLTGIALLAAPYRLLLLAMAALCLTAGAGLMWRRQPAGACATGSVCSKPVGPWHDDDRPHRRADVAGDRLSLCVRHL